MQKMNLDFARQRRLAGPAGWLLLTVGAVCVTALVVWVQVDRQPRLGEREAALRKLQATLTARQPAAVKMDDKQLADEWLRAMRVAGDLSLPWEKLFGILEANAGRPVALLTLEPDAVKHEIALTAEAKNFDEMLGYYRVLQQQDMFAGVALQTHQVNQQDREKPIRFRITAKWAVKS
jgi:Tfp pilus assembly protein PilN